MGEFTALVLLCGALTTLWRASGVVLAKGINMEGELFRWVSCVAFAMIAGLVARIVLMPTGPMADTALAERLAATGCTLVVFFVLTRRNLFAGVLAGAVALTLVRFLAA